MLFPSIFIRSLLSPFLLWPGLSSFRSCSFLSSTRVSVCAIFLTLLVCKTASAFTASGIAIAPQAVFVGSQRHPRRALNFQEVQLNNRYGCHNYNHNHNHGAYICQKSRTLGSATHLATFPLYHMGHSHSHHHHQRDGDGTGSTTTLKKTQILKRVGISLVAAILCIVLPKLALQLTTTTNASTAKVASATSLLSTNDVGTCGMIMAMLLSRTKLRAMFHQQRQKLQSLQTAIRQHSPQHNHDYNHNHKDHAEDGRILETSSSHDGNMLESKTEQKNQNNHQAFNKDKNEKSSFNSKSTVTDRDNNSKEFTRNSMSSQKSSDPMAGSDAASTMEIRAADQVTWIGIYMNIALSLSKWIVGIHQQSAVLLADAAHSASDLISDFITLTSVSLARLPPDEDHPYGHFKFEALGSFVLSLTLLASGVGVGAMAYQQLLPYLPPPSTVWSGIRNFVGTWTGQTVAVNTISAKAAVTSAASTVSHASIPGPYALVMALVSILSKEWLFRITKKVGNRISSPVVLANAWHHRSDAYSSILALLSIGWARAGIGAADPAAGLLVAGMICYTGFEILSTSIQQLSDSAPTELQSRLKDVVGTFCEQDPDVLRWTSVKARRTMGNAAMVEVTIETWPDLTTTATRAVEERLNSYLLKWADDQGHDQFNEDTPNSISVTVHAKAPLESPSIILEQETKDGASTRSSKDKVQAGSLPSKTMSDSLSPMNGDSNRQENKGTKHAFSLSASQVELQIRQQASRLDLPLRIPSVVVHYLSANSVAVDVTVSYDENQQGNDKFNNTDKTSTMSLPRLQSNAKTLQTALHDLEEVQSARIYLDLLEENESLDSVSESLPSWSHLLETRTAFPDSVIQSISATTFNGSSTPNMGTRI